MRKKAIEFISQEVNHSVILGMYLKELRVEFNEFF